jgi:hypothetical protein
VQAFRLCFATIFAMAVQVAYGAETCTGEIAGMQFCAEVIGKPRVGEKVTIAVVTRNVGLPKVSALSLVNVPDSERSRFVGLWAHKRRVVEIRGGLRPGYLVQMSKGDSIRAVVLTDYSAQVGRNEIHMDIPYPVPSGPSFSEADIRAFRETMWPAPKVYPLIGPLVFDAK